MKKILSYIAVCTVVISSALPVSACTFNFYINRATQAAINSFADQTSNVVKALVLGKEKSLDTAKTTSDIINSYQNPSISNLTPGSYNNLTDFTNSWGENHNINFNGFNPNDFFVASGQGSLTKTVEAYQATNTTLSSIRQVSNLAIADNALAYGQLQNNSSIRNTVYGFLNNLKKTDPKTMDATSIYLRNLIIGKDWSNPNNQNFKTSIVDPLSFMLNYLVNNTWRVGSDDTTPSNASALNSFMNKWNDPDGKPYTEWIGFFGGWSLRSEYINPWNTVDYNFYRAGTLLNWLFYKIGKDYQIIKPGGTSYRDRYLGGIISDHLILLPLPPKLDEKNLLLDLAQYLPHLLENPLYLLTIAQAIIPIVKYFGLNGDVTKGTSHLTFGNVYPTDKSKESYNFSDFITNLQALINDPDKLRNVIKTILGWAPIGTPGQSFLYDIAVGAGLYYPLGDLMKEGGKLDIDTKNTLVKTVMDEIDSANVKGIINSVANVYNNWIKPYNDQGSGIDISLQALKEFLINPTNGLLVVINQDLIVSTLFPIITKSEQMDQAQYDQFYTGLGGQLPNPTLPINFRTNSVLDLLQQNIANTNQPLGKIALILFGNSTQGKKGIFDNVTDSNNLWIKEHYTAFFDANNLTMGKTYNQAMETTVVDNNYVSTLQYYFEFTINNKTYKFLVKCISHNDVASFKGTKTFRFTAIDLLSN